MLCASVVTQGDSVSFESEDITRLNCNKYTSTCRDYAWMYDRQGDRVNIVFCKMEDGAKNMTHVFERILPAKRFDFYFSTSETYGTDGADATEYFLHSFYYYPWPHSHTILCLIDVTRGAEVWQKSYPSHEFPYVDTFLFGDGFVVVAKLSYQEDEYKIELEIIQTQSGETLANHTLCIGSDDDFFYLRVQNQMIIYVNKYVDSVTCMGDNFTIFLLDGAAPSKEPEQFSLRVSKNYRSLEEVVLVGSSHLIACLCPLDSEHSATIQSKLCFIVFDLHARVEVRRVFLNNLAYVSCLGQVFLLRQADGKKKMEVETKILLCGFNRSLAMLNTLTKLQLQST